MKESRGKRARLRRGIAWAVAVASVSAATAGALPVASVAAGVPTAAGPYGSTVVIDGHGFGHGIGLSQYGALGYALSGSPWTWILDHYYGGTVAGTIGNEWISTRLIALDGGNTSVVSGPSGTPLATSADGGAAPWQSLVAIPIGANVYDVWGHASAAACAAGDLAAAGWQQIGSVAGPIEFWSTVPDSTTADLSQLIGSCEAGGQVRSHRGSIVAATDSSGNRRTLTMQPVETYLRSVVGAEVPWSWGDQGGGAGMHALYAQAVAARSYALAQRRYTYQNAGGALAAAASTCDTQACQVYRGAALRSSVAAGFSGNAIYEFPNTDWAVGATAGAIRRWPDGRVVSTMFSSSSGGYTSGGAGFTPVVDDGDAVASNGRHDWRLSIPVSTIEAKWPAIGSLQSIVVNQRNGLGDMGGRITPELGKVVVITGDQGSVALTGDETRLALGLYSNWFAIGVCNGRDEPTVTANESTTPATGFVPIAPERVIDTRNGVGTSAAPVRQGCTLPVSFPSKPSGATAVAINITTTNSAAQGFITAYPCGTPRPLTAVVQTKVGDGNDIPGTTLVSLGPDGRVCLYTSVPTDIVVDVMGWFKPTGGSKYLPETPERLLDTRLLGPRPAAFTETRVQVTGGSRPGSATAASINVAATEAATGGYVTVYPCANRDLTSVVNIRPGLDISNHALVPLDAAGGFCLWSSTSVHLVVDIDGVFSPTAPQSFRFWRPERAVDTRSGFGSAGRFAQFESRAIDLGAASGSVTFELTVVDPALPGHVTVWKPSSTSDTCVGSVPTTAVVNAPANTNVAALVIVPTDADGRICVNTHMPTDLVIDISGRSS
ncbi:MAG: SpoIID/LytB domain-containing protein [Acidimicrobiia bacterium]